MIDDLRAWIAYKLVYWALKIYPKVAEEMTTTVIKAITKASKP